MFAAINSIFTGSQKLQTYTFPSGTTTWTAPTSVTNLVVVSGKGSDGTAGYWGGVGRIGALTVFTTTPRPNPNATSPTYGDLFAQYGAAAYNATTGVRTVTGYFYNEFNNSGSSGGTWGSNFQTPFSALVDGAAYNRVEIYTSTDSTKIADYVGSGYSLASNTQVPNIYIDPTDGVDTTGFGKTFPGGVAGPATTTTFTNVAVTPGTTYTIVNNGSLTIQYYA